MTDLRDSRIASLESALSTVNADLTDQQRRAGRLQADKDELQAKVKAQATELRDSRRANQLLGAELTEARRRIRELEQMVGILASSERAA